MQTSTATPIVPTEFATLACGCKRMQITAEPSVGFVRQFCLEHAVPCKICRVTLVRTGIVCPQCMAATS